MIFVGCAGWALGSPHLASFPAEGAHLERYAQRFNAVEINTSFYRPHQQKTYARWAASVPSAFRFAVKVPKEITHTRRLIGYQSALDRFLGESAGLGAKLGPYLVQLPPSLALDPDAANAFFEGFRARHSGAIACEPRHATWFTSTGDALLDSWHISRVAADPAPVQGAFVDRGKMAYLRLHGSPEMYYSTYSSEFLAETAARLQWARRAGRASWCIFDNTAAGHAIPNALSLQARLGEEASAGELPPSQDLTSSCRRCL